MRLKIILCKSKYLNFLILVLLVAIVYWPVLFNHFLMLWDDQWVCINDYTESGLTIKNIWNVLTEFYGAQYAPINELYYILMYTFFGYNPFWFHLGGVFIHLANVLLVYIFINRLLLQAKDVELDSAKRIAFFSAILFAIHPILVEPVAWIGASKVLIYAFFYLLALIAYLKYIRSNQPVFYLLVFFCFFISFGAKEQAVVLPLCLLLVDYILKRNFRDKQVWLEKIPFFLQSIFFGIITMYSQSVFDCGILSDQNSYPFFQRIVFACYSIMEYLTKCLIPIRLSYIYPFPNQVGDPVPNQFLIYPFIIAFLVMSLWSFWKKRWVLFSVLFFLIHLLLVLNIVSISRFSIVADRYAYISSIGVFFLLAWLLNVIIVKYKKYFLIAATVCIIYVVYLITYAHSRTYVWYDYKTLKNELIMSIQKRPDYNPKTKKINIESTIKY